MKPLFPALVAALLAAPALAQHAMPQHGTGHAGHATDMTAAMQTMMEEMAVAPSGDADIDFARAMIAHHRGAVEMARLLLETGDDLEMRALAEDVITAQEAEITVMEEWLARQPG